MSASPPTGSRRAARIRGSFLCRAQRQRGICGNLGSERADGRRDLPSRHEAVPIPSACASTPPMSRPVEEHVFTAPGPMRDQTAVALRRTGVPSVRAIGIPNVASGVATRRSHARAMAQPPPAATPST